MLEALDLENLEMEDSEGEEENGGALPPLGDEDRSRLLRAINGDGSQSGAFPFLARRESWSEEPSKGRTECEENEGGHHGHQDHTHFHPK